MLMMRQNQHKKGPLGSHAMVARPLFGLPRAAGPLYLAVFIPELTTQALTCTSIFCADCDDPPDCRLFPRVLGYTSRDICTVDGLHTPLPLPPIHKKCSYFELPSMG